MNASSTLLGIIRRCNRSISQPRRGAQIACVVFHESRTRTTKLAWQVSGHANAMHLREDASNKTAWNDMTTGYKMGRSDIFEN